MIINFHETQLKAIDFISNAIKKRKPIVGLTGAGGTGKSEILSYIVNNDESGVEIYTSASTHKAASRLKKDLPDTTTLHSAVAIPHYTSLYNNLDKFFKRDTEDYKLHKSSKDYLFQHNVIDIDSFNGINELIASLGKTVFDEDFFNGYQVQKPVLNSCLFIDEASMVPSKSIWKDGSLITIGVDTASRVYDTIVLIGDMYQLPPINGKSSFEDIETIELTKNYRSDKGLLRCLDFVRNGGNLYNYQVEEGEKEVVNLVSGISQSWYDATFMRNDVVHICYTNKTRHATTKAVRKGQSQKPIEGEPLLFKGFSTGTINKGDIGIYKNGKIDFGDDIELKLKSYHIADEYNQKGWSIFSFGYALTAHFSQGSGFDNVIVHAYDIPHFIDNNTKMKWLYTACSRSKKCLTIIL